MSDKHSRCTQDHRAASDGLRGPFFRLSACQIRRNPRNRSRTQRSAFRPRQGDPTQNDKSTQRFREDVEFDYRTALFTQPRPIPDTAWTTLHLDAKARSLVAAASTDATTIEYETLGEGVTFSMVAAEDTEITGPLAAKLHVSSSTPDADLFLIFKVFDPDGEEVTYQGALDPHTPVAHGWLRASHRKLDKDLSLPFRPFHTHDEMQPLTPGEIYELDIEIWPTSIVVPAGWTIALTIQGHDYQYSDTVEQVGWFTMTGVGPFKHDDPSDRPSDLFDGKVTLHFGDGRESFVVVPIIPPR